MRELKSLSSINIEKVVPNAYIYARHCLIVYDLFDVTHSFR